MGDLTPKQEAFCLAFIETGNASEAYRSAYNATRMKPESVHRKAKELVDHGKVSARLVVLREKLAKAAGMSLEQHLADLKTLRDMAKDEGKYSAAVAAEMARGKVSGFYVERLEHSGEIKTPELKLVLNGTRASPATV